MTNTSDSSSNDQTDVIHHPLFLMPPPPPPPSSSSPISVHHFPGDPTKCFSPRGRKRYIQSHGNDVIDNVSVAQRKRSVSFNPRVRARDSLSRNDMTHIERRAYWVQDDEYQVIIRRNARIVREIEKSYDNNNKKRTKKKDGKPQKPQSPEDLCPRGLENGLKSEYRTREAAISESLEEIFNEQEKQYYVGVFDDEAIATAYSKVASKCQFRAQLRAMLDRKEIEDYASEHNEYVFPVRRSSRTNPTKSGSTTTSSGNRKPRITGVMLRGVMLGKQLASIRSWVRTGSKALTRTERKQ